MCEQRQQAVFFTKKHNRKLIRAVLALAGLCFCMTPGAVMAEDLAYDPDTAVSGTYQNITGFDGGDTLKLKSDGTLTLGADGQAFKIYDAAGGEIPRDNILHVDLSGDTVNFGPGPWTVADGGSFIIDLSGDNGFTLSQPAGGDSEFTVNGGMVFVNGKFSLGSTGNANDGAKGVLAINGGNVYFGGYTIFGSQGQSGGNGGGGEVSISGGVSRFGGWQNNLGNIGDSGGNGGEGRLTITGGVNTFKSTDPNRTISLDIGRYGSNVSIAGPGGRGGEGYLTISGGTNIFEAYMRLGSNGGSSSVNYMYAQPGDGLVEISGGKSIFTKSLGIGSNSGISGMAGASGTLTISGGYTALTGTDAQKQSTSIGGINSNSANPSGQGVVNITGGILYAQNAEITLRGISTAQGAFTLDGSGRFVAGVGTILTVHTFVFDGSGGAALGFDLSQARDSLDATPTTNLTVKSNTIFSATTQATVEIDALGAQTGTYDLALVESGSGSFTGWDTTAAITIRDVDAAQTRAAGQVALQLAASGSGSDNLLQLVQDAATGIVTWDTGAAVTDWDLTSAGWDTSAVGTGLASQFLAGDAVLFDDTAARTINVTAGGVRINEHGANPGMEIASGDWTFTGGEIEGGAILISDMSGNDTKLQFDSRSMNQQIRIQNTFAGATQAKVYVSPVSGETLTFQGFDAAFTNEGMGDLFLGAAGASTIFSSNASAYVNQAGSMGRVFISAGDNVFSNHADSVFKATVVNIEDGQNIFINNQSTSDGGVASATTYDSDWIGYASITGGTNTFADNTAAGSGGVFASDDHTAINGGTNVFDANAATGDGGALYAQNLADVSDGANTFINNRAGGFGGAVYAAEDAAVFANTADMTFKGNLQQVGTGSEKPNAVYVAAASDSNSLTLKAASGKTLYFYDPVASDASKTGLTTHINGGASETPVDGTVLFDTHRSEIYGTAIVYGGVVKLTNGAALGASKTGLASLTVNTPGALYADVYGNTVSAGTLNLQNAAAITADMLGAAARDSAGATTNLFLDTDNVAIANGGKVAVDVINLSGTSGVYTIIDAGDFNFTADNLTATLNGSAITDSSVNIRYGGTSFDYTSETGKLLLVLGQTADIARTAAWQGGSGVWSETAGNFTLEGSPYNVFKNGDSVVFNGDGADAAITVAATGTSTSLIVQALEVAGSNNWSFSGDDITGSATGGATADFTMNGSGTVAFENAVSFDNFLVNGGTFNIGSGSITGDITVGGGGSVGGGGTVNGNIIVDNGGFLRPGNSIGTVTTTNLELKAGSTYVAEISETAGDLTIVQAGGNATIDPAASLVVENETPGTTWSTDGRYVIIEVQGGGSVSNVFGSLNASALPFLTITQELSAAGDQLILVSTYKAQTDVGQTANQMAVENAIAALPAGNAVQNAMANAASEEQGRAYLDGFSGEIHSGLSTALLDHDRYFMRALRTQVASYDEMAKGFPLWVSAGGFSSGTDSSGLSGKSSYKGYDVALGAEAHIMNVWQVGAVFRYTDGEYKVKSGRNSKADVDSYTIGLYGGRDFELGPGALRLFLGGTYAWHEVDSRRAINTGTMQERLKGDYSARSAQIGVEVGYRLPVTASFDVEPYFGAAWNTVKFNSFTEKGGDAALHVGSKSGDNVSTSLGMRGEIDITQGVSASADVAWLHTYGSLRHDGKYRFSQGGVDDFTVKGAPLDRDAVGIGLDLKVKPVESMSVKLGYNGVMGSNVSSHGGKITLTWEF